MYGSYIRLIYTKSVSERNRTIRMLTAAANSRSTNRIVYIDLDSRYVDETDSTRLYGESTLFIWRLNELQKRYLKDIVSVKMFPFVLPNAPYSITGTNRIAVEMLEINRKAYCNVVDGRIDRYNFVFNAVYNSPESYSDVLGEDSLYPFYPYDRILDTFYKLNDNMNAIDFRRPFTSVDIYLVAYGPFYPTLSLTYPANTATHGRANLDGFQAVTRNYQWSIPTEPARKKEHFISTNVVDVSDLQIQHLDTVSLRFKNPFQTIQFDATQLVNEYPGQHFTITRGPLNKPLLQCNSPVYLDHLDHIVCEGFAADTPDDVAIVAEMNNPSGVKITRCVAEGYTFIVENQMVGEVTQTPMRITFMSKFFKIRLEIVVKG